MKPFEESAPTLPRAHGSGRLSSAGADPEAHSPYEALVAPDVPGVGEGQRLGAEPLEAFFARTPRLAVAFSGGCDSAYLLAAAQRAGCEVRAYLMATAFQPAFERADAQRLAEELGIGLQVVEADVLARPDICANGPDRCYLCKGLVFGALGAAAASDGFEVLADGTNASDDPSRRPGFRALAEQGVASPLRRAGLTKQAVRAASRRLGLFTADKPRFSCLAVHVPAGQPLTAASLDEAARACGIL